MFAALSQMGLIQLKTKCKSIHWAGYSTIISFQCFSSTDRLITRTVINNRIVIYSSLKVVHKNNIEYRARINISTIWSAELALLVWIAQCNVSHIDITGQQENKYKV